jgi:putative phage-type endonuclease
MNNLNEDDNQCNFILISGKNKGTQCKSSSKFNNLCNRHSTYVNKTINQPQIEIEIENENKNNLNMLSNLLTNTISNNIIHNNEKENENENENENEKENDMNIDLLNEYRLTPLKTIEDLRTIVKQLRKIEFHPQRSEGWHKQRNKVITASSAADLLKRDNTCDPYIEEFNLFNEFKKDNRCCNPYSSTKDYIIKKCNIGPSFKGNFATNWGVKYEPVATKIYEFKKNTTIIEFGLLNHPNIEWLAASPDGITPDGTMLEIKCPYSRNISGIPPLYYWIQVQLQLEVTDLEVCDFEECRFSEYLSETSYLNDSKDSETDYLSKDNKMKGIIGIVKNIKNEYEFIYPSLNKSLKNMKKEINNCKSKTIENYVYWKLEVYSCIPIKRSRIWFNSVKNIFQSKWTEILEYRNNIELLDTYIKDNCTHKKYINLHSELYPNDNTYKDELIIIDSDDSDNDNNNSNSNSKCLILLDEDENENENTKSKSKSKSNCLINLDWN